jgi:tripartite-type tricarboxylate transporter receptor subunit TctC
MSNRIRAGIPGICLLFCASAAVHAQTYPVKPVRLIVSYAPGGAVDMVARLVGQKLGDNLGRQVLVENRPGGSANIGSEMVARAAPDGYTLLMASSANATNMSLFSKLSYDTLRDFAPVSQVGYGPQVLAMHPSLPVKSVSDLLTLARSRPGQLQYASGGNGSSQHLAGEMMKIMGKVDILHVPYKGGAPALIDVISGQCAYMFINTLEVMPYIQSGRLKALAVAAPRRSAVLPDTPTFSQSGLPGFEAVAWWGIVAPAGTPRDIIGRLSGDIVKGLNTPELKERFAGLGAEIVGSSPDQFAVFLRDEVQKWGKVINTLGIKAE